MSRAAIQDEYGYFFKSVSAASHRVLMVDYDGTLAPFTRDRHRAVPYPQIPSLLRRIMDSCDTRVIVVSGRAAAEIPPLLNLHPSPEIWGAHGVERIQANGRHEEIPVDEDALRLLATAESELDDGDLTPYIEVKLAGVAVHWRGLASSDVLKIRTKVHRVLEPFARRPHLTLAEFEQGVELRLSAASKGNAMQDLLSQIAGDVPVAYLGDDSTDEDAFRVLNDRGLSVLVRPQYRFTAAKTWLQPPGDLIKFLIDWARACGRAK